MEELKDQATKDLTSGSTLIPNREAQTTAGRVGFIEALNVLLEAKLADSEETRDE